MKILCVIPARYASSRLPGKPLLDLAGKPMLQHVYERACRAKRPERVLVATDDPRILQAVKAFGGEAVLTSPAHLTGTDRLAEVARLWPEYGLIVNVQGDEPLIESVVIDNLAAAFDDRPQLDMATLAHPMAEDDYNNPAAVKVVSDRQGRALYFSRSLIPYPRNAAEQQSVWKHIGLYAYRREFLLQYAQLPPTPLEQMESLEQLRALEHGFTIQVLPTSFQSVGVDTQEDLERVRARLLSVKEETK